MLKLASNELSKLKHTKWIWTAGKIKWQYTLMEIKIFWCLGTLKVFKFFNVVKHLTMRSHCSKQNINWPTDFLGQINNCVFYPQTSMSLPLSEHSFKICAQPLSGIGMWWGKSADSDRGGAYQGSGSSAGQAASGSEKLQHSCKPAAHRVQQDIWLWSAPAGLRCQLLASTARQTLPCCQGKEPPPPKILYYSRCLQMDHDLSWRERLQCLMKCDIK